MVKGNFTKKKQTSKYTTLEGSSVTVSSLCFTVSGKSQPRTKQTIACVASVSVWFRSKEIPKKGTFGFDRARNETRAKK